MSHIKPLDVEVVKYITASKDISSIPQIVNELVQNSLDAHATRIQVSISSSKLSVEVVDNGDGISPDDMKVLGIRNVTSKCSSVADLDNVSTFGYRGDALASISQVSMLEMTSRQKRCEVTFSITLRGSQQITVGPATTHRIEHGSTVKVRDCFFNMPVRRKIIMSQISEAILEQCKRAMFALALNAPSVSFVLIESDHGTRILQTKTPSNLRDMFRRTFNEDIFSETRELKGHVNAIQVDAVIAKNGHNTTQHQYVFVNGRSLHRCELHTQINEYVEMNLNEDKVDDEMVDRLLSPRRTRSNVRKLRRYPAYIVRIRCPTHFCDFGFDSAKSIVAFAEPLLIERAIAQVFQPFVSARTPSVSNMPDTASSNANDDCAIHSDHTAATSLKRSRSEDKEISQKSFKRSQSGQGGRNRSVHHLRPRSVLTGAALVRECIKAWKNPAFPIAEPVLPQADDVDELNKVLSNFEASDLGKAQVLGQVDSKFIACILHSGTGRQLVLIDQHAADERIRVEVLQKQLVEGAMEAVEIPLKFSHSEISLLRRYRHALQRWSIEMNDAVEKADEVWVTTLPECVSERLCEPSILKATMLRHVYDLEDGLISAVHHSQRNRSIQNCPRGIRELLNSKACRYAIMFNQQLALGKCQEIVSDLSRCQFPFQCAHGRPSVYPLLQLRESVSRVRRPQRAVSATRWRRFITNM